MNNNYTFKWKLEERGFKEVAHDDYTVNNLNKHVYVEKYLSPSVSHANCGWACVKYYVLASEYGIEEYAVLYPDETCEGGRYYNVTGDSLGAIAKTIWRGVFA